MKDKRRNDILVKLISKEITLKETSRRLRLSKRQVIRLKVAYLKDGVESIPHKSRNKPTGRGYSNELKEKIIKLYLSEYLGWNFYHFNDALHDEHDINVSDSFIYNLLTNAGIKSPRKTKRKKKAHPPRQRRENAGELVQFDASQHHWFHNDKAMYYLHGGIDDSTGIVTGAFFAKQETIYGYQMVLKQTIQNYGIPECLYTDYRTIFRSPKKELTIEEELKGKQINNTKYTKMIKKLGIDIISTSDPRAKGRIERLWGTFQDRLYNEMKKLKIFTIKEANEFLVDIFLPKYNNRFASPIDFNRNLFVCVDDDFDYNSQLAVSHKMTIYHNCYLSINKVFYIILDNDTPAFIHSKGKLDVYTFLDGSINLFYRDRFFNTVSVDSSVVSCPLRKSTPQPSIKTKTKQPLKPNKNHPWKNSTITKNWDLYKRSDSIPR